MFLWLALLDQIRENLKLDRALVSIASQRVWVLDRVQANLVNQGKSEINSFVLNKSGFIGKFRESWGKWKKKVIISGNSYNVFVCQVCLLLQYKNRFILSIFFVCWEIQQKISKVSENFEKYRCSKSFRKRPGKHPW